MVKRRADLQGKNSTNRLQSELEKLISVGMGHHHHRTLFASCEGSQLTTEVSCSDYIAGTDR